jgi:hypothetical protein
VTQVDPLPPKQRVMGSPDRIAIEAHAPRDAYGCVTMLAVPAMTRRVDRLFARLDRVVTPDGRTGDEWGLCVVQHGLQFSGRAICQPNEVGLYSDPTQNRSWDGAQERILCGIAGAD